MPTVLSISAISTSICARPMWWRRNSSSSIRRPWRDDRQDAKGQDAKRMTKLFVNPAVTRTHPGTEIYDRAGAEALRALFATAPGFAPTPLKSLERTARQLGVGEIWAKDERHRWGLGSFKSLGGAYA